MHLKYLLWFMFLARTYQWCIVTPRCIVLSSCTYSTIPFYAQLVVGSITTDYGVRRHNVPYQKERRAWIVIRVIPIHYIYNFSRPFCSRSFCLYSVRLNQFFFLQFVLADFLYKLKT